MERFSRGVKAEVHADGFVVGCGVAEKGVEFGEVGALEEKAAGDLREARTAASMAAASSMAVEKRRKVLLILLILLMLLLMASRGAMAVTARQRAVDRVVEREKTDVWLPWL